MPGPSAPIAAGDALRTWVCAFRAHLPAHAARGAPHARDCARCRDLVAYFNAARAHYGDALLVLCGPPMPGAGRLAAVLAALGVLPPLPGGRA